MFWGWGVIIVTDRDETAFIYGSFHLPYKTTNESLSSIVKGLDIKQGDDVFAICGSGDQAFAMLAAGADHVYAIDNDEGAIEFAQSRLELLCRDREDLFSYFVGKNNLNYLTDAGMEIIRSNYDKICFGHSNILTCDITGQYNKIYLSNVFNNLGHCSFAEFDPWFERVSSHFSEGALVYSACPIPSDSVSSRLLEYAEELTDIARADRSSYSNPVVYRKVV